MPDRVSAPSTPQIDKTQMHFALGKAYEDSKDYDTAFSHYQAGNTLKRETSNHSKEQLDIRISTQLDVCTAELFERLNDVGHDAPDPIFILGLPRAGSTLLEQILASHSKVDGTMELHDILDLAKRLRGRDKASDPSPAIRASSESYQLSDLRSLVNSSLRIHAPTEEPRPISSTRCPITFSTSA